MDQTPAAISQYVYTVITDVTKIEDPYKDQKKETNIASLEMLPYLRKIINSSSDPLNSALHVAVAGNIIDMGIGHKFNIKKYVMEIMNQNFAINAIEDFCAELTSGKKILYLGDNAGEIVFDILLIEQLFKAEAEVTFTVKSAPIINDATMKDAEAAGLTKIVKVMETGSNDIGINWKKVSREFMETFETTDIIISKGHGNFETCNNKHGNFYFLLKAKCGIVADALKVKEGDIVFKRSCI